MLVQYRFTLLWSMDHHVTWDAGHNFKNYSSTLHFDQVRTYVHVYCIVTRISYHLWLLLKYDYPPLRLCRKKVGCTFFHTADLIFYPDTFRPQPVLWYYMWIELYCKVENTSWSPGHARGHIAASTFPRWRYFVSFNVTSFQNTFTVNELFWNCIGVQFPAFLFLLR